MINISCHCTQQWTLDWTLSCLMPLHSAIFAIVIRTVAFVIFFLVFGPPHALCHSNCFFIFVKIVLFVVFVILVGVFWTLSSLRKITQNFFCNFRQNCCFRQFSWGLWTLSCLTKALINFMLCLSVSLTTSDYLEFLHFS